MNEDVAKRLARQHIAQQLAGPYPPDQGEMQRLQDRCENIAAALEQDDTPEIQDIEEARTLLRMVDDHLDDVCALYDIPRWKTNVRWGDLTDAEREEYEERRSDC